jgi:hypothetical protein
MFTFISRTLSRACIAAVLALAGSGLLVQSALADQISISGTHSAAEIKATCDKVGGQFSDIGGGGYGCRTDKGSVRCSNGSCVGECSNCKAFQPNRNGAPNLNSVIGNPARQTVTAQTLPASTQVKPPPLAVEHLPVKKITGSPVTRDRPHHAH